MDLDMTLALEVVTWHKNMAWLFNWYGLIYFIHYSIPFIIPFIPLLAYLFNWLENWLAHWQDGYGIVWRPDQSMHKSSWLYVLSLGQNPYSNKQATTGAEARTPLPNPLPGRLWEKTSPALEEAALT